MPLYTHEVSNVEKKLSQKQTRGPISIVQNGNSRRTCEGSGKKTHIELLGGLFCVSTLVPKSLEVEKQVENENTKGARAHGMFERVTLSSVNKLSCYPPARLIPHLECDKNVEKNRVSPHVTRLARTCNGTTYSKK